MQRSVLCRVRGRELACECAGSKRRASGVRMTVRPMGEGGEGRREGGRGRERRVYGRCGSWASPMMTSGIRLPGGCQLRIDRSRAKAVVVG